MGKKISARRRFKYTVTDVTEKEKIRFLAVSFPDVCLTNTELNCSRVRFLWLVGI